MVGECKQRLLHHITMTHSYSHHTHELFVVSVYYGLLLQLLIPTHLWSSWEVHSIRVDVTAS